MLSFFEILCLLVAVFFIVGHVTNFLGVLRRRIREDPSLCLHVACFLSGMAWLIWLLHERWLALLPDRPAPIYTYSSDSAEDQSDFMCGWQEWSEDLYDLFAAKWTFWSMMFARLCHPFRYSEEELNEMAFYLVLPAMNIAVFAVIIDGCRDWTITRRLPSLALRLSVCAGSAIKAGYILARDRSVVILLSALNVGLVQRLSTAQAALSDALKRESQAVALIARYDKQIKAYDDTTAALKSTCNLLEAACTTWYTENQELKKCGTRLPDLDHEHKINLMQETINQQACRMRALHFNQTHTVASRVESSEPAVEEKRVGECNDTQGTTGSARSGAELTKKEARIDELLKIIKQKETREIQLEYEFSRQQQSILNEHSRYKKLEEKLRLVTAAGKAILEQRSYFFANRLDQAAEADDIMSEKVEQHERERAAWIREKQQLEADVERMARENAEATRTASLLRSRLKESTKEMETLAAANQEAPSASSRELNGLRAKLKLGEAKLKLGEAAYAKLSAQHQQCSELPTDAAALQSELEARTAALAEKSQAFEALAAIHNSCPSRDMLAKLSAGGTTDVAMQAELHRLSNIETEKKAAERTAQKATESLQSAQNTIAAQQGELQRLQAIVQESVAAREAADAANQQLQMLGAHYEQQETEIQRLRTVEAAKIAAENRATEAANQASQADSQRNQLQASAQWANQRVELLEADVAKYKRQIADAEEAVDDAETKTQEARDRHVAERTKWTNGQRDQQRVSAERAAEIERLRAKLQKLEDDALFGAPTDAEEKLMRCEATVATQQQTIQTLSSMHQASTGAGRRVCNGCSTLAAEKEMLADLLEKKKDMVEELEAENDNLSGENDELMQKLGAGVICVGCQKPRDVLPKQAADLAGALAGSRDGERAWLSSLASFSPFLSPQPASGSGTGHEDTSVLDDEVIYDGEPDADMDA